MAITQGTNITKYAKTAHRRLNSKNGIDIGKSGIDRSEGIINTS